MKKELFRIFNLSIRQNQSAVLSNLYLQVFEGEHTGILFNSFYERTAFLDFIDGKISEVEGIIYFEETAVTYQDYIRSYKKETAIIYESSRLMNSLSVYENLFYEQLSFLWITAKKYKKMAENLFEFFHLSLDVNQKVKSLNNFERIAVELVKAFLQGKKLIFLSNAASLLDAGEFEQLLSILKVLEKHGITFLIGETFDIRLFRLTCTLHLIKNGQTLRILPRSQICQEEIQRSLGSYSVLRHQKSHHQDKDIKESVLAFDNVQDILPAPLSFTLKKGQILKIICSSNRETDYLLSILRRRASAGSGSILFRGQPLQSVSLNQYLKSCGIIESNPRRTVLFHNMTVLYNLCVPLDSKIHNFWTNPGNQKGVEYTLKDIIPPGYLQMNIDQVPMEIVQKVIYCRWLLYVPELLVCMNPFSIIDTSLNQITLDMLRLLSSKGIAVLIISNNWTMDTEIEGEAVFLTQE
ncbi:MAG: hypothetical protein KH304_03225 [Clostridium sp.]|nr:hypothetical protein [Clostridium sp.]